MEQCQERLAEDEGVLGVIVSGSIAHGFKKYAGESPLQYKRYRLKIFEPIKLSS